MARELSMQEHLRWIESHKEEGQSFKQATKIAAEYNIIGNFEGTVCQVDNIAERFKEKQTKYIELHSGIKREYKSTSVYQINIV